MKGGMGDRILGGKHYARGTHKFIEDGQLRERTIFNWQYKVQPGRLPIPVDILKWAESEGVSNFVLVSPHVKKSGGRSKDWGWDRWLELVSRSPYLLLQCDYGLPVLPGVRSIATPTFEHGAALLKMSRGVVTTEGGMHHAAGALRKPAVVIFGGTNPPSVLGYEFHQNLAVDNQDALGRRGEHPSCREAMAHITVDWVLEAMQRAFGDP